MVWLSQSARVRPARAEGSRRLSTRVPAVPRSGIHRPSYSRILTAESHLAAAAEDARPWPLFSAGTACCICRTLLLHLPDTAWHSLTITVARSSSSSALRWHRCYAACFRAALRRALCSYVLCRVVSLMCMPWCMFHAGHCAGGRNGRCAQGARDRPGTPVAVGYKPHHCACTVVACVHVRPMTKASCTVRMPIGTLRSALVECCEEQPLIGLALRPMTGRRPLGLTSTL